MEELEFGKDVDDIEEPTLIPEGWREFELLEDPKTMPNAAFKDDPNAEKAGHNWVAHLATVDEDPMFNGRRFTIWLPLPKAGDETDYDAKGMKKYDAKMARLADFAEKFGGRKSGTKIAVGKGGRGKCYVLQGINKITGSIENSIDIFNMGFKPAGE